MRCLPNDFVLLAIPWVMLHPKLLVYFQMHFSLHETCQKAAHRLYPKNDRDWFKCNARLHFAPWRKCHQVHISQLPNLCNPQGCTDCIWWMMREKALASDTNYYLYNHKRCTLYSIKKIYCIHFSFNTSLASYWDIYKQVWHITHMQEMKYP